MARRARLLAARAIATSQARPFATLPAPAMAPRHPCDPCLVPGARRQRGDGATGATRGAQTTTTTGAIVASGGAVPCLSALFFSEIYGRTAGEPKGYLARGIAPEVFCGRRAPPVGRLGGGTVRHSLVFILVSFPLEFLTSVPPSFQGRNPIRPRFFLGIVGRGDLWGRWPAPVPPRDNGPGGVVRALYVL